jgi:hypothetical protein
MDAAKRAKYNEDLVNKYSGTAVSTCLAGFIQVINMVMIIIVREFSLFERHETKTKMNISLSFKLGFMRFMTSSICYLLVHKNAYDYYVGANLVYDITMVLFFLAANPIIMLFCDIDVMYKKYRRWVEQGKGDDSNLTQKEANMLYEGSPIDVENNLSNYLNLILTCLFYSPILPHAIPIAFIGSLLNYIVTKFMLVNFHKQPEELSDLLVVFFVNVLPFAAVVWTGAYLFFLNQTVDGLDIINGERQKNFRISNLTAQAPNGWNEKE